MLFLNLMNDIYYTIDVPAEGVWKDRGSRFIATAFPVESEQSVEEHLAVQKRSHPKARHHCFAWRLGVDGDRFRANDDGEPSGTAGQPILRQIDKLTLTNVLVVVVRYFGGTLLGTGGLVQAYKGAAADALQRTHRVRRFLKQDLHVTTGYAHLNEIIDYVKSNGWPMLHEAYGKLCTFEVQVRLSQVDRVREFLQNFEDTKVETL